MRTEDKVTRSERGVKSLMKALSGDPDFLAASSVLVRGEAAAKPTVALASAEPSKSFVHSNWLVTENPGIRDLLENNQLADRVVVTTDPFVRSSAYDVGVFVHDAFTADSTVLFEMSRLILNSKAKKAFVLTHKGTGAQRLARRMADELGFQVSLEARGSGGIRVFKVGASGETGRLDPPYQRVDVSGPGQPALDLLTTPSLFSPDRVDPGSMMLIEYALNLIGDERREQCLLDLGCGYGAVGLSLTSRLPNTNVAMTDADARAVYVCRKNVSRLSQCPGHAYRRRTGGKGGV